MRRAAARSFIRHNSFVRYQRKMATLNLGAAKRLRKELQNLERGKTAGSTGSSFGKSSGDDDDDVWANVDAR